MTKYLVATGHRPPRLGLDYSPESNRQLTEFAKSVLGGLTSEFAAVSGMAQGWDQAFAHAALLLKIPLVCVLPFRGHGENWPAEARARHDAILGRAKEVVYSHDGPYDNNPDLYIRRDHKMVWMARDSGGSVVALWDGKRSGGTWKTVRFALDERVSVLSVWCQWLSWCNPQ